MNFPKVNWWGILGVAVGVLSLLAGMSGACVWLYKQGKDAGKNEIRLQYAAEENKALTEAQNRIAELTAELQETERQIYEDAKNETGVLPDSVLRQLERMRRNEAVRDGSSN